MRIDAHQHFWRYDPERDAWIDEQMTAIARDFMPQDLNPVLAAQGFDGCVAVQADESPAETDLLLELAEAHPWILKVVGWLDPGSDRVMSELDRLADQPRLAGFRHILQALEPEVVEQPAYREGIKAIGERGYTFDLLVHPRHLPAVTDLARSFPHQPFVVDHMAKPNLAQGLASEEGAKWESDMRRIAEHDNVYCKVSGLVTEADWNAWEASDFAPFLDVVFDCFGADRLMYGSDWPVCLLAASAGEVLDVVKAYLHPFSDNESAQVLGGTAGRFYGISS